VPHSAGEITLRGRVWPIAGPDAFGDWNFISSIGAYVFAVGMAVFFLNMVLAFARKQQAAVNPWGEGATTLEWTLPSPPPFHQFETLPVVGSPSLKTQVPEAAASNRGQRRIASFTRGMTKG
jgi:heme/copper-type cytochrome/quinol oxidase subunit 1